MMVGRGVVPIPHRNGMFNRKYLYFDAGALSFLPAGRQGSFLCTSKEGTKGNFKTKESRIAAQAMKGRTEKSSCKESKNKKAAKKTSAASKKLED
jgi:hypothetical protein